MPLDPLTIQRVYHQTKQESEHVLAGYFKPSPPSFKRAPTPFFNWLYPTTPRKVGIILHRSRHMCPDQHTQMVHMAGLVTWIATSLGHQVGAYISHTHTGLPFQPHLMGSLLHHALSPPHTTSEYPPLTRCLLAMHHAHPDRGVMVVLSDFIEPDWAATLYTMAQSHDVMPVVMHDHSPLQWPVTRIPVTHPVTGQTQWINPQAPLTRARIQSSWAAHTHQLAQAFQLCCLRPLTLHPDTPPHTVLVPKDSLS